MRRKSGIKGMRLSGISRGTIDQQSEQFLSCEQEKEER
jgi:hypothetical protein